MSEKTETERAEEAGAGFAVVVEEVRSLTQRSTAAAQETVELIVNCTTQSNAAAAEQAAATSVDLGSMVNRVTGLVGSLQLLVDGDRSTQK